MLCVCVCVRVRQIKKYLKENERYFLVSFYWHTNWRTHTYTHSGLVTHFLNWTIPKKAVLLYPNCVMLQWILHENWTIELKSAFLLLVSFHYTFVCVCQNTNCCCCSLYTNTMLEQNIIDAQKTLWNTWLSQVYEKLLPHLNKR